MFASRRVCSVGVSVLCVVFAVRVCSREESIAHKGSPFRLAILDENEKTRVRFHFSTPTSISAFNDGQACPKTDLRNP